MYKYIMHIERNGDGTVLTGSKELNPTRGVARVHWEPNIVDMYNKLGFNDVTVIDVPDGFNQAGASHFVVVDVSKKSY